MQKLQVDNETAFLFGFADVTFPTITRDLKTTLKYKGPEKYLKGHQHLIYSHIRQVADFEYIVAQWVREEDTTIQAVHTIPYRVDDFDKLEKSIVEKIEGFFTYLREHNLWDDYYTIFSKN